MPSISPRDQWYKSACCFNCKAKGKRLYRRFGITETKVYCMKCAGVSNIFIEEDDKVLSTHKRSFGECFVPVYLNMDGQRITHEKACRDNYASDRIVWQALFDVGEAEHLKQEAALRKQSLVSKVKKKFDIPLDKVASGEIKDIDTYTPYKNPCGEISLPLK